MIVFITIWLCYFQLKFLFKIYFCLIDQNNCSCGGGRRWTNKQTKLFFFVLTHTRYYTLIKITRKTGEKKERKILIIIVGCPHVQSNRNNCNKEIVHIDTHTDTRDKHANNYYTCCTVRNVETIWQRLESGESGERENILYVFDLKEIWNLKLSNWRSSGGRMKAKQTKKNTRKMYVHWWIITTTHTNDWWNWRL